jgi:hypothetical protein
MSDVYEARAARPFGDEAVAMGRWMSVRLVINQSLGKTMRMLGFTSEQRLVLHS